MKFKNIKIAALAFTLSVVTFSCSRDFTETVFNQDEIAGDWKTTDRMHSFVLGAYVDMRQEEYYGKDFQLFAEVDLMKCSPMGLPDTIKRCTIIICCLMMAMQGIHMKEFIK